MPETDAKPEADLIISDLLQRAYNATMKGEDVSDLVGAVMLLREADSP